MPRQGTFVLRPSLGLLSALLAAAPASAADEALPARLTLDWALERARERNPDVQAAQARYLAMRERPSQAGALPDPELGLRYHNEDWGTTFGDSEFSFFEVAAEQEVPFPGKLGLRERIALREAERERAMRDMTLLMVLSEVATTHADLAAVERSGEILRENQRVLELIVEQAAARYAVGEAVQPDVLRAAQERGVLEERLTMLARRRAALRAALAARLDLGEAGLPPTGGLDGVPLVAPLEELEARLAENSPTLRAAQEELLRAGEELRLAHRDSFPDFALMGAYMNKGRLLPEWEVGARVSVPLYFWRKQRAAVAEAFHAERAAERTRRNTELALEARLADLHAMAMASQRLVALYADTLIPQGIATLESARASYAVGEVDFLTTLSAWSSLLEYRLRHAEESGNLRRAVAEIGPLVGETPLGEPLGTPP
jgi:outer membrane protein TolC